MLVTNILIKKPFHWNKLAKIIAWTDLYIDGKNNGGQIQIKIKIDSAQAESWVEKNFPGVPVEVFEEKCPTCHKPK